MKFWKRLIALLIGNGTSQVINFVFMILLVRVFEPLDYATYKQGNLIISTLTPFLSFGLPVALSYFISKKEFQLNKNYFIKQTVLVLIITGFLGSFFIWMLRFNISEIYNNPLLKYNIVFFSITLFFEVSTSYYPFYMTAENRNVRLTVVTIFFGFTRVATLLAAININKSLSFFMLLYCLNSVVRGIYIHYDTIKNSEFNWFEFNGELLYKLLIFSLPIALSNIIYTINAYMGNNIVSYFYTPLQYAIYVNGAYEIPIIALITGSIMSALLPEFCSLYDKNNKYNLDKIIKKWNESTVLAAIVMIPIMYVCLVFADSIIVILFSKTYILSIPIFMIYSLSVPGKLTYFGTLLTAANKQKKLVQFGFISMIINIILFFITKLFFSFNMLALVNILSIYIMDFLMLKSICKVYLTSWKNAFPWKSICLLLLINGVIAILFIFIKKQMINNDILKFILIAPLMYIISTIISIILIPNTRNTIYIYLCNFYLKRKGKRDE